MARYTQKAILQTFQEMLEEMPFDKITVSALVSRCDISSNTFYYHYHDIYDLLDTWFSLKRAKYREAIESGICWQDASKATLHELKKNPDIVYHLFNSLSMDRIEKFIFESSDDTFYKQVCEKTKEVHIPEEELRNIAEYNSYSFLGFFLKFLWNYMNDDIDAGIDKISRIFDYNIQGVIAKYKS